MVEPDRGKVYLADQDVTDWPMYRRARDGGMGYLAQESSVFRKLTVRQNIIGMFVKILAIRAKPQDRKSLREFLADYAAKNNIPLRKVNKKAAGYINEIAANYNLRSINFLILLD